jgi:hypothetical protein
MKWYWINAYVALVGALGAVLGAAPAEQRPSETVPFLYTATTHYDPLAWLRGGDRFPSGPELLLFDGKNSRSLIPGFFGSADASISFDGTRVLFAGKQHRSDPWQIWEVGVSGENLHRLTTCTDDCVFPLYLPEDRFVYAHKVRGSFQLEAMPIKGGDSLVLTHVPGNALPSDVLRDGRILFQAAYPLGSNSSTELYTVYSDGSGVESYRCDHGNQRFSGRQTSSGDIVFSNGSHLARFTSALAHQADVVVTPSGEFAGDLAETATGDFLVAWRPHSKVRFSVGHWSPRSNALTPVIAKSGFDLVQPRLVGQRTIPNRHPSGLHDWDGANVLCLNAYTSKFSFENDVIAAVRLYTGDAHGQKLLGSSLVEKDGSFFIHVPADQPLKFELVDRTGKVLQREKGWYWMRRGEQRVCVGCHAGPERAPENAVPAVLVKSTEPVDLTRSHSAPHNGGH